VGRAPEPRGAYMVERAPATGGNSGELMRPARIPIVVTAALLAVAGAPPAGARPVTDPPAQASAKPCLPARGLVVAMTIRRKLKHGSEVTEPSPTADTGSRAATPRGARRSACRSCRSPT